MKRYDLEFKKGCEMFARMVIDIEDGEDICKKAVKTLCAISEDGDKLVFVDIFTRGNFVNRLYRNNR